MDSFSVLLCTHHHAKLTVRCRNHCLNCSRYSHNIKIIHFIGATKPWHYTFNTATGKIEGDSMTHHKQRFLQLWWSLFLEKVQPHLDPNTVSDVVCVRCMRACAYVAWSCLCVIKECLHVQLFSQKRLDKTGGILICILHTQKWLNENGDE